jgi:hypothetical protein
VTRKFGSEAGVATTVLMLSVAGSVLFGGTFSAAQGPGDDGGGNHNGSPGRPGEAHAHCQFVPSNSPSVCRESRPDGSNARGGDGTNGTDGPGGRNGQDGANSTYDGAGH